MLKALKKLLISILALIAVFTVGVRILGFTPLNIETMSMEPKYPVGTLVYVKSVDFDDLQSGDVITYVNQSQSNVTHRITSIDFAERSVRTKGDANEFEDIMEVYEENIVGKVMFAIPYLGHVSSFITEQYNSLISERSNSENEQI